MILIPLRNILKKKFHLDSTIFFINDWRWSHFYFRYAYKNRNIGQFHPQNDPISPYKYSGTTHTIRIHISSGAYKKQLSLLDISFAVHLSLKASSCKSE